jgi:hypothetical protein
MTIDRISQLAKLSIGLFAASTIGSIAIQANSASAASLVIPTTTVNGTDVFSGPSFTVTSDFLGTDTISLNVSGTVELASGNYTTNAAGILTQYSPVFNSVAGNAFTNSFGEKYGALLLGNSTIGFYNLFEPNAANGLGSANPPTNLSLTNISLSSIGFSSGLTDGTVLQFRVSDEDTFNNSSAFTVSGSIDGTTTAVPEPFTIIGTLIGGTAAFRIRKKLGANRSETTID